MSCKRAGIVGWTARHSLSPVLHGYWLKEYGIDGEFVRLPAPPDAFAQVIAQAQQDGFAGVNVTVPHKEAAFKLSVRHDRASQICGAVNLLTFGPDGIAGRNTDHTGLYESLSENLGAQAMAGKTAILLGAGGAARGAVLALDEMSVAQIYIINRHQARADSLAHEMALNVKARLVPGTFASWLSVAGEAALLLNTTSAGMRGNEPLELDLSPLPAGAAVCDIVYDPLHTDLLKNAAARGHKTIDGLGMLMHQAVPSFEAFFGAHPTVTPGLRAALETALHDR